MAETKKQFLDAWSETLLKMWRGKMLALNVYDSGELYNSLSRTLGGTGGDVSRIDLLYKTYGIYAAIGVGRNRAASKQQRKKKDWYYDVFYRELMKLKEYMAYRYGAEAPGMITSIWQQAFEEGSTSIKNTLNSLRTKINREGYRSGADPGWKGYIRLNE
jgi:hypothetical protein